VDLDIFSLKTLNNGSAWE